MCLVVMKSDDNLTTKLDWANWWSKLGFSVVPVHYVKPDGSCSCSQGHNCASPGKHPAPKSWAVFQEKCADEYTLEMWFNGRYKDYNIGVVTGKVSGNVFAVDIDTSDGKLGNDSLMDLCMANDDLPETLEQLTGGGGRHYLFKAPDDKAIITGKNTLGSGIDTRGEGGFIVVAPSNHKSGNQYKVAHNSDMEQSPEWLVNLLDAPQYTQENIQNGEQNMWGEHIDGREGYMVKLILGTIRSWWGQKGILPTVDQLIEECWPIYERKVKARGENLSNDKRGLDLFKQRSWYQLKRASKNELRILHNVEAGSEKHLANLSNPLNQVSEEGSILVAPDATPPLLITDWGMHRYAGKAPDQEWLVDNILPRRVPGLIAAIGGLGKSYILLDLCLKVAGGDQTMHTETAFGGNIIHNGKVVFFGAEDSASSIHRRIDAISNPTLRDRAENNLFIVPMPDAGGTNAFIGQHQGQYSFTAFYQNIKKQLLDFGEVALVVIDPLQAFAHADINTDPAAAQYWWSLMSELCVSINGNVLVAHHMRKDGTFAIKKSMQAREAIRGTTALVDGARWVYGLWNMPEADEIVVAQKMGFDAGQGTCVCGGIVKVNDQADMSTHTFVREEGGLLIDRSGEVDAILEASAKLDRGQTTSIFTEIEKRWNNEQPFAVGNNTQRSFLAWIKSDYGMPSRSAKNYMNAWLDQGYLEVATIDGHKNLKGLRVVKQPD